MNEARRESSSKFLGMRFPERQIYIRSEGRVHFCTFSPLAQAIMAGASLLCLGWFAFTTVNVVFKDRIISAKEQHFEQMQASYEGRIAELQLAYDELNGALVAAQDRFKSVADEFEAKQLALTGLIEQKQALRASLGIGKGQELKGRQGGGHDACTPDRHAWHRWCSRLCQPRYRAVVHSALRRRRGDRNDLPCRGIQIPSGPVPAGRRSAIGIAFRAAALHSHRRQPRDP